MVLIVGVDLWLEWGDYLVTVKDLRYLETGLRIECQPPVERPLDSKRSLKKNEWKKSEMKWKLKINERRWKWEKFLEHVIS